MNNTPCNCVSSAAKEMTSFADGDGKLADVLKISDRRITEEILDPGFIKRNSNIKNVWFSHGYGSTYTFDRDTGP